MLRDIAQWPLRKPLALFAALLVGGAVVVCLYQGKDIPPEISGLLKWFGGIALTAYYGTSTVEAVKGVGKRCPNDGG